MSHQELKTAIHRQELSPYINDDDDDDEGVDKHDHHRLTSLK